jgi:predicted nucleic acid-binding protein
MSAVAMEEPDGLYGRAISLASQFQLGSTYDTLYLALAETRECEFWTAARRFVRSLRGQFPQVRWIGEGLG